MICGVIRSLVLFQLLFFSCTSWGNVVVPKCSPDEICEFDLELEQRYTMVYYDGDEETSTYNFRPLVASDDGKLHYRDCDGNMLSGTVPDEVAPQIPTADGNYKMAMMINRQIPAPPIIVYEGQELIVRVINHMESEGTTIHWHGLHQRGTPWMDGTGGVSHCNINPGETFTYRFIADQVGTHWYHSHYASQRSMGLAGPLIVLPRPDQGKLKQSYDGEFHLVISDWFEESSHDILHHFLNGADRFHMPELDGCVSPVNQEDGIIASNVNFHSAIINGKGWVYDKDTDLPTNTNQPLEVFKVTRGQKYRFRVITAALIYAFKISIDGHKLHMIASDGHDFVATPVDSFIIQGGERYDFYIEANDPEDLGNYWIRAETLVNELSGHHVEAILRYSGSNEELPESKPKTCSAPGHCQTLNCPFKEYPGHDHNTNCIHLTDLKLATESPTLPVEPSNFMETFLSFHFRAPVISVLQFKPAINGRRNRLPYGPPNIYPEKFLDSLITCNVSADTGSYCHGTHLLQYPLGTVVQLNLFNTDRIIPPGFGTFNHPIHLHGHQFQVIKQGFPRYNEDGEFLNDNTDMRCNNLFCTDVTWSNSSWLGGNVPDIITSEAPLKDTLLIPFGGYAVVRFRADNPGFWFMHCHMEIHNGGGMSLVVQEGEPSQMPPAPSSIPRCGPVDWDNYKTTQSSKPTDVKSIDKSTKDIPLNLLKKTIQKLKKTKPNK